jgi:tRNA pseudouridine32 synthase / 23S rRNA pseudouridine746 synthase
MGFAKVPHQVPTREGVSPSCVVVPAPHWPDCVSFLADRIPAVPRADWLQRMQQGGVVNAQNQPVAPDAPCTPGLRLYYWREVPFEHEVPFPIGIVHQCEHLVVADKPHFLPISPKGRHVQQTLLVKLKRLTGIDTLVPVHRIDLETAGLVAFSVQPTERAAYQRLFAERQVRKVYEAIAPVRPDLVFPMRCLTRLEESPQFMAMHTVPGEPNADTFIELLRTFTGPNGQPLGHYRLHPRTGRKHQLRAQMDHLGLPLLNDRIYPTLQPELPAHEAPDHTRPMQLLACSLAFEDPITGQAHTFHTQQSLQAGRS